MNGEEESREIVTEWVVREVGKKTKNRSSVVKSEVEQKVKEDEVILSVKGCWEIKEDEDGV